MSRHKLIKSMNVNEELDDFDGGSDYEDEIGGGEEGAWGTIRCVSNH